MTENHFLTNLRSRPAAHTRTMADDLRKLADTLERHAKQYEGEAEKPSAAHKLTGRVVHDLSWGWANLNFDLLVQSSIDVDSALAAEAELAEWEYSVGGHEHVVLSTKEAALNYNENLKLVDVDPGTVVRRRAGSKPGEWEVAP